MTTPKPKMKAIRDWKLQERFFDRHVVEAICPHGVGHEQGTHGCDGCCANAPKEMWKEVKRLNRLIKALKKKR